MNFYFWRNKLRQFGRYLERKNKFLYCLGRLVKNINNQDILTQMALAGRGEDDFCIKHFGGKNKYTNIYYIYMNASGRGLGAYLHMLVSALYLADQLGFIPVVCFGEKCMYCETDKIMGTNNPFEYYYAPVSEISVEDVKESQNVFFYREAHFKHVANLLLQGKVTGNWSGYCNDVNYIESLSNVVKKYLRLNSITQKFITDNETKIFGGEDIKRFLGIHIRGTDFKVGWSNHPLAVYPQDYFSIIDEKLDTQYDYIFLATDDTEYLGMFQERYGDRIKYYQDVHRENGTVSVAMKSTGHDMEHYRNGLEILRDIYTLAHCDGLVAGVSQVSFCAQLFCFATGKKFSFVKIIDKGINR